MGFDSLYHSLTDGQGGRGFALKGGDNPSGLAPFLLDLLMHTHLGRAGRLRGHLRAGGSGAGTLFMDEKRPLPGENRPGRCAGWLIEGRRPLSGF